MFASSRRSLARCVVNAGLALALAVMPLAACSGGSSAAGGTGSGSEAAADTAQYSSNDGAAELLSAAVTNDDGTVDLLDTSGMFTDRDLDSSYDESDVTATITLSDTGSTADGGGVTVDGGTVTITEEGVYVLSGSLSDGQVIVDAEDAKVQLVLSGVSIASSSSAGVYVRDADKVFLTLADGTENSVSATGSFVAIDDNNVDGAVFAKDTLVINGGGSLDVSCSEGHGIVCKDDLKLVSGSVTVNAYGHAVQAKDSVRIAGGTWNLTSQTDDGIHADNDEDTSQGWVFVAGGSLTITSAEDGINASCVFQMDGGSITVDAGDDGIHSDYDLVINGGSVDVTESYEGVEGSTITVAGGTVSVVSSDDGFNAAGVPSENNATEGGSWGFGDMAGFGYDETAWLLISGGTIYVDASGDGLDSNGDLTVTGGETYVSGPTSSADGAIDYGEGGTATITGGIVIAAGSSGMAENFDSGSTQGAALVTLSGNAGDTVTVTDADGSVLASYAPTKQYACVVVSAPGMITGGTYTVSNSSGSVEVTLDSVIYSDVQGGMGGFGGGDMGGQMGGQPGGDMGGQMGGGQQPTGGPGR